MDFLGSFEGHGRVRWPANRAARLQQNRPKEDAPHLCGGWVLGGGGGGGAYLWGWSLQPAVGSGAASRLGLQRRQSGWASWGVLQVGWVAPAGV